MICLKWGAIREGGMSIHTLSMLFAAAPWLSKMPTASASFSIAAKCIAVRPAWYDGYGS